MDRKLDGVFFRIERNGKIENVCFSDMTTKEKDEVVWERNKDAEYWKRMAYIMADCLKKIGDELDIVCEQCGSL